MESGAGSSHPSRIGRIMSLIGLTDLCGLIECTGGQGLRVKIKVLCLALHVKECSSLRINFLSKNTSFQTQSVVET